MRWRGDDAARRTEQQAEASMKIGPFDVKAVDECLDVLEDCFQSPMWRELSQEEKTRLIGRLSYILEITEKQELEK
jgi:hypothetical protein